MQNLLPVKTLVIMTGLAVVAGGALLLAGRMAPNAVLSGIDISKTKCEEISSARLRVATEFEEAKQSAQSALDAAREAASDAYWEKNRQLEGEYHQCISRALSADPCKEAFEEIGRLYEEIMADFAADKGFNEAKFNEREAAKERYYKCVEDAKKPEAYSDRERACTEAFDAGKGANQQVRSDAEARAQSAFEATVRSAEEVFRGKQAILDAIEKTCNEPGGTTRMSIGPLTTETSGATIQLSSSACTGVFAGNDPEIQKQIATLESQLKKAKAGGQTGGLFGTDHIQEALDRLREELKDSPRTCKVDADCGQIEPVCCSGTTVGRAYCNAGVCATEKTECVAPEICGGKPAQCIAPIMGAEQSDGIYISRTIPEVGSCSQNLQVLDLTQGTPESVRYSINGTIPDWLHIDKPGGSLPGKVNVTYSCGTVQGFGPGTYSVAGSVTVYDAGNKLINTIPFNVSITVTKSEKTVEVIEYAGKLILLSEVHQFDGVVDECDGKAHWHANSGAARALDGSMVPDPGGCGYGTLDSVPVKTVPDTRSLRGEVRGLEGLQTH